MRYPQYAALLAVPIALALTACEADSAHEGDSATAEPVDKTISDLIDDRGDLSISSAIIDNAQLDSVFSGPAPYTLLAPNDDAYADVPEEQLASFQDEAMGAKAATLVLAHILPGYVGLADLKKSIASDEDGSVEMKTMGGDMVIFRTGDGDAIIVSREGGPVATISDGVGGNNGGLLIVSAPLVAVDNGLSETPE